MTINTTANRKEYTGNGVTTPFSFPYYFLADADLVVELVVIATGVEVPQTLTTHYTVTGAGNPAGGAVTFVTPPPATHSIVIYRDPSAIQDVDLVEGDPLPVETAVEQPLDKLTMIVQRVKELIGRALRLPEGDTGFLDSDLYLPAKVTRASKYLGFDANGKPIATAGTTDATVHSAFIQTLHDDADAQTARETLGLLVETGTFTATLSGMTAAVTGTIRYFKYDKLVTLVAPSAITGTSNTTAMIMTGLPAALQISEENGQQRQFPTVITDNGVKVIALASLEPGIPGDSDTIIFSMGAGFSATGFTNSGTKGIPQHWTFQYMLGTG